MGKPNFFIVGAPKCGTTALSEYLRTHPNIFFSTPKELYYFNCETPRERCCKTLDGYLDVFKDTQDQHQAIGEASVSYLNSEIALQGILNFNANAKIIVMLRNPLEFVSSYHSQVYLSGYEDVADFKKAWKLCSVRKQGKKIPVACEYPPELFYDNLGKFGTQIENLYKIFPQEQVHIILMDDIQKNTKKVYMEVLNFLGIPDDKRKDFSVMHERKKNRIQFLGRFRTRPPKHLMKVVRYMKHMLGIENISLLSNLHKWNRAKSEKIELDNEFKGQLLNEFSSDIDKLSLLIQRDLSHWKRI